MSQISKALKKIQEIRENYQYQKAARVIPAANVPLDAPANDIPLKDMLVEDAPLKEIPVRDEKITDIAQVNDHQNPLIIALAVSSIAALISVVALIVTIQNTGTKQTKVISLEKTIKTQEKQINDIITYLNKTKNISDSQTRALSLRLKQETEDREDQINNLASSDKNTYENLKEAILDDKNEINYLDKGMNNMKQAVDRISAEETQAVETQAKALENPAAGN